MECDFCSDKNVARKFECMDFEAESKDAGVIYNGTHTTGGPTNLVLKSINFWAACPVCADLVDEEDLNGLVAHAVMAFNARGQRVSVDTARHMRHAYQLFFKHRIRVKEDSEVSGS
jgi:hypothetical protein